MANDPIVVPSVIKDFEVQADAALAQIAANKAILADSPTTAQVIAVLDNVLTRQAKEVRVLRRMLRQMKK